MAEQKIKYKRAKDVKHITLCTCDGSTGHEFDPNDADCKLTAFNAEDLEVYGNSVSH